LPIRRRQQKPAANRQSGNQPIRNLLTGHDLNAAQVRRAIELSETRYCSIYATLRAVVEITSDFEIVAG